MIQIVGLPSYLMVISARSVRILDSRSWSGEQAKVGLVRQDVVMSTAHPHLGELHEQRSRRRRRTWIGVALMFAALIAAAVFIVVNAGRWGVPMFPFTNAYGSQCRNDWLGHTCTRLTMADIERHLAVDIPDEATILSSRWKQTHDYALTARLSYPQAVAREGWDALGEKYGACQQDLPSPLSTVPDLSGTCVMTNEGGGELGGTPSPQIWRIATATQADGDTMVDIHLRSR